MSESELVSRRHPIPVTGRPSSLRILLAVGLALTVMGCGAAGSENDANLQQRVVYGDDDRSEPFAGGQPTWLTEVASTRLLALGDQADVSVSSDGEVNVDAPTLRQRFDVCDSEEFSAQPSFALCSALIVSSRYALTAAHCARALPLGQQVGVSRFYNEPGGELHRLEPGDLHSFTKIVARDDYWDYAWLELTKPIPALGAATVGPLANGEEVVSVHHSAGLPAKVTRSTAVGVEETSFVSTLDAFGGASGGPIFSATGTLVGVLTSGASDYVLGADGCFVSARRVDAADAAAERAVRVDFALEELCAVADDSELCPSSDTASVEPGCAFVRSGALNSRESAGPLLAAGLTMLGLCRWGRRRARETLDAVRERV